MATAGTVVYERIINKSMPWWASFKPIGCPKCGQEMGKDTTPNKQYRLFTCDHCKLIIRDKKDEKPERKTG